MNKIKEDKTKHGQYRTKYKTPMRSNGNPWKPRKIKEKLGQPRKT